MNEDPICNFLRALPGYNPLNLETDRRVIVEKHYSLEGLQYLWEDVQQDGENPIGLFLYRVGKGMQSPTYHAVLTERRRQAEISEQTAQALEQIKQREERVQPPAVEPPTACPVESGILMDGSLTQPIHKPSSMTPEMVWQAALGELQVEMTRATYETWVKPTRLLSVNGTWKIGVPNTYAQEWLERRLKSTVKRVLTGVVGEPVEPEFVVVKR